MPIGLGNRNFDGIFLGNKKIKSVYLGDKLIYEDYIDLIFEENFSSFYGCDLPISVEIIVKFKNKVYALNGSFEDILKFKVPKKTDINVCIKTYFSNDLCTLSDNHISNAYLNLSTKLFDGKPSYNTPVISTSDFTTNISNFSKDAAISEDIEDSAVECEYTIKSSESNIYKYYSIAALTPIFISFDFSQYSFSVDLTPSTKTYLYKKEENYTDGEEIFSTSPLLYGYTKNGEEYTAYAVLAPILGSGYSNSEYNVETRVSLFYRDDTSGEYDTSQGYSILFSEPIVPNQDNIEIIENTEYDNYCPSTSLGENTSFNYIITFKNLNYSNNKTLSNNNTTIGNFLYILSKNFSAQTNYTDYQFIGLKHLNKLRVELTEKFANQLAINNYGKFRTTFNYSGFNHSGMTSYEKNSFSETYEGLPIPLRLYDGYYENCFSIPENRANNFMKIEGFCNRFKLQYYVTETNKTYDNIFYDGKFYSTRGNDVYRFYYYYVVNDGSKYSYNIKYIYISAKNNIPLIAFSDSKLDKDEENSIIFESETIQKYENAYFHLYDYYKNQTFKIFVENNELRYKNEKNINQFLSDELNHIEWKELNSSAFNLTIENGYDIYADPSKHSFIELKVDPTCTVDKSYNGTEIGSSFYYIFSQKHSLYELGTPKLLERTIF